GITSRGGEVVERVKTGQILVFDGGYGTMLFAAGLLNGACPELWNDTHADVVAGIHRGYFDAGSDIVETNTFGGARLKLNEYALGDRTRELNVKGAQLARKVAPAHGLDRTMWGESPAEVAKNLLAAGADVVGMNCGRGPDRAIVIIREMRAVTDAPLVAYPNAGLPVTTGDTVTYELGPEAMARDYPALLDAGCNIVGACCGSNPEHIRLIAKVVRAAGRRGAGAPPAEASP